MNILRIPAALPRIGILLLASLSLRLPADVLLTTNGAKIVGKITLIQGGIVVIYSIPEEVARATVADPTVMVASDGMPITGPKVHPRGQGTFSRVLGHYVREEKALDLMTALRKMTLMPAQRLEKRAPAFKDKGRLRVGADADVTVFDPDRIIDKATYEEPLQYSDGIQFVLVNGVTVVNNGQLVDGVMPGRGARAPTAH